MQRCNFHRFNFEKEINFPGHVSFLKVSTALKCLRKNCAIEKQKISAVKKFPYK